MTENLTTLYSSPTLTQGTAMTATSTKRLESLMILLRIAGEGLLVMVGSLSWYYAVFHMIKIILMMIILAMFAK